MVAVDKYDPQKGASFCNFLWRVVANEFNDTCRKLKQRRREEFRDMSTLPHKRGADPSRIREVEEAIERENRDDPESYAIMKLWWDQKMPRGFFREAAKILEIMRYSKTPSAWRNVKWRNMCKLRRILKDGGDD